MEFWLYVGLIEINVKTMEEHYRIFYVYYRNIITVRYNSVFFIFCYLGKGFNGKIILK